MPYIKIEVPDGFDQERPWKLVAGIESHDLNVWSSEYRKVLDHGYVGLVDFMGDDSRSWPSCAIPSHDPRC